MLRGEVLCLQKPAWTSDLPYFIVFPEIELYLSVNW